MSPISKAKRVYTFKKNALIRLLDPVPACLQDHSVGKLKLEEVRKRCVAAWDAFTVAYEDLADAQSEDEAQDQEIEERDQEFSNLEARYHDLVDSLAETVLQRETQAEAERVLQEKQAETDCLQHEKTDQIAVRRLHIVSLYGEAKESLSQLHDQLNLEELPS